MITALSIVIAILIIGLVCCILAIKNLLNQNNQLEESLQIYSNKIESIENDVIKHYEYFMELFSKTYIEMQQIDRRGSFASDDEVGFVFRVLFTAIENVKLKLQAIKPTPPEEPT